MDRARGPIRITPLALAAAILIPASLGGCGAIWKAIFGGPSRQFSHRQHMDVGEGFFLECTDCHKPALEGAKYDIGGHPVCQGCHGKQVEGEPGEKCLKCHTEESPQAAQIRDYLGRELIFFHGDHESLDCEGCHRESGLGGKSMTITSMSQCIGCHESSSVTTECESCHRDIRKDLPPPSHDDFFLPNHGRVAGLTRGYCQSCHTEDDCVACHDTMKPRSHTLRWKDMAHGIYAVRDRKSCAVCHSAESCEKCHSIRPQSHMRPAWDAGTGHREQARLRLRSCFACHDFQDTCEVCHTGRADIGIVKDR